MSITKQTIQSDSSQIERVTVFPDRAEIRRKIPLKLEQGINEISINNVLGQICEDSVRASGAGMASIHDIEIGWKNVTKGTLEEAIELRKALIECERAEAWMLVRRNLLKDKLAGLQRLYQNVVGSTTEKKEKGESSNFVVNRSTLDGFKELFDFYEQQATEFGKQEQVLIKEEDECKEKTKEAKQKLNKCIKEKTIRIIKVNLETEEACEVDLFLSYQVTQAEWRPSYDIRVDAMGEEEKMNITYFGCVTQESGEEWRNCRLILSTAIPSFGGSLPPLGTLGVSFKERTPQPCGTTFGASSSGLFGSQPASQTSTSTSGALFGAAPARAPPAEVAKPEMVQVTATVEEQTLASEFTINRLITIPSDNGEHKVTIGVAQVSPILSRESATNTSSLSFLPGKAAIFLDGNFINKIHLKSVSPGEHFSFSLGVDSSIKVIRQPAHNSQGEAGLISKWNTIVKEQKYMVKNSRNEKAVTFYEQIPRSLKERIVVKLLSPDAEIYFEIIPETMSTVQSIECKSTTIERVTVFSDRAEIRRNVALKLETGMNEINIINLPGDILDDSVRISGTGNASIHEVQVAWKEATKKEKDCPQAVELRQKLEVAERENTLIKNRRKILQKKREALDALIGKLGNTQGAQSVQFNAETFEGIGSLFEYYENQVLQFNDSESSLEKEENESNEKVQVIRNELNRYEYPGSVRAVTVILESPEAGEASLTMNYQVYNAFWRPSYDIRVDSKEEEKHMNITYSGRVSQNSGEEWSGCQLVLSTASPSVGGNIPELGTLDVSLYVKPDPQQNYGGYGVMQMERCAARAAPMMMKCGNAAMDTATVQEQALSSEFVIARPAAIPPDGAEHKVTIGAASFQPNLQHECVPSKNNNVYLIGSTRNSSSLPFLPGEAAIFLDGNFITKSQLKAVSPGEYFAVSLGQDASIKVDYKPAHNKQGEAGLINKNNTQVKEQKVIVKNTRKEKVKVTIKEHVPRSTDEKIKVRLLSPTPAPLQHIPEDK
ncbi:unnamed protein product, partial [Mesorhabditis belari]|uniref:Protein F37C4.5 n=1 Tax=Mesorhabditis belari TaxID=2138241 RepID=A0AAF3EEC9_9BILA